MKKSAYNYLKKYKLIYVIGHKNYDVDSYISSYLMTKIFNYLKINAKWGILDKTHLDLYSNKLLDDCKISDTPFVIDIDNMNNQYFLTDHNDVNQSIKTIENVVGSFDHHLNLKEYEHIFITKRCACSLGIYEEFKAFYPFTIDDKKCIYMAFLSDSTYTKNSRCEKEDIILAEKLGFSKNYVDLFNKYFIFTDFTKDFADLLFEAYKEYTVNKISFGSNYLKTKDFQELEKFKEQIINYPKDFLGILVNYNDNKTIAYFKYNNKIIEFKYDFIASRAKTVINDVSDYLKEEVNEEKKKD